MFNKQDILICMALREEGGAELIEAGANVLFTGLGKVNATYSLTKQIAKARPKLVLNIGTAGSKLFKRGEMVSCHRFIQRDMDVSPLGFKPFKTPFEEVPLVVEHKKVIRTLPHATCGTGDSFEIDHNQDRGEVVDMEAYALAKVCLFENIDFTALKYISDGADDEATQHWQESLKTAPVRFVEVFNKITY